MSATPRHASASTLLNGLVESSDTPELTLGDILAALEDRAFGLVLLIFALPNCFPGPPGLGSVLGLPCMLFGAQMMLGRRRPWMPAFITRRRIRRRDLAAVLNKATPWILRLERLCRPRLTWLTSPISERWLGAVVVVLAICIAIPLPMTNLIPAVGIFLMALGLLQEDGVAAIVGLLVGLVGLIITIGAVGAVIAAIGFALG